MKHDKKTVGEEKIFKNCNKNFEVSIIPDSMIPASIQVCPEKKDLVSDFFYLFFFKVFSKISPSSTLVTALPICHSTFPQLPQDT